MVEIRVSENLRERDRQNRRQTIRLLIRTFAYLTSLIPALIVAWKMDMLPFVGQPAPQVVVQQPQALQPKPTVVQQPPPVTTARVQVPIEAARIEREIEREIEPVERVVEKRPSQEIALSLDAKTQRVPIMLVGDVRIARIDGSDYKLSRKGLPVEATLQGPRPVLLTITENNRMLIIEPTVTTDAGKSIPFTITNLNSIGRRIVRDGQRAAAQVAAMTSERDRLQAWVESPVLKPLAARNEAVARIKQLGISIEEGKRIVAALEIEVKAAQELAEWAQRLQEECVVVVEAGD